MRGHCNATLKVTFRAAEHHWPLTSSKWYCLVTGEQGCEQLAQSCYAAASDPGVKPATSWSQIRHPFCCTTTPLELLILWWHACTTVLSWLLTGTVVCGAISSTNQGIIIIIQHLYSALKSCKGYGGAGGFRLRLSEQVCFEVFFKGV